VITVTSGQLNAWLVLMLWPFARILALLASAPVTGNAQFPASAKIGLAILITVLVAPTLPLPTVDPGSGAGLLLLARETALGIAMGLAMRIVFAGISMAGDVIGLQMGLSFAQFYDPQSNSQAAVAGQYLGLLATLTFLSLNGHLVMIATLIESFHTVPVDAVGAGQWLLLAQSGGMVVHAAVLLALPLIATLLVVNAALAVLTRSAPQLNIFAIGFPITMIVGFVALMLSLPYCVPALQGLFETGIGTMLQVATPAR
jgi:flagellar biosynthetic protein FliR